MAASAGSAELVHFLVSQGASWEVYNAKGWSPVHFATRNGHVAVSKMFLDLGADINDKTGDDWSLLQFACFNGYTELAEMLLERKAHVDQYNKEIGFNALQMAISKKHTEIVRYNAHKVDNAFGICAMLVHFINYTCQRYKRERKGKIIRVCLTGYAG